MCWQCPVLKCFPPRRPPLLLCKRKWQPATSHSGEREFICAAHQKLFVCIFEGVRKDGDTKTANPICSMHLKKSNKKQALNSLLYLSARFPCSWRAHASLSLLHAFIPISGCVWQGKLSAGDDFVFLLKKKKKKKTFCYGPSGLNATPRGKLRENGNRWRPSGPTVLHVVPPPVRSIVCSLCRLFFPRESNELSGSASLNWLFG